MAESDHQKTIILLSAGLLICLLVLSAYSNTLYSPFVLDDIHSFVKEQKVLGCTFDVVGFENLARSKFGIRRLLPMLTFVFDIKVSGARLAAFHMTNIIIHLLATFSLFFLLQSLMLFPKAKFNSGLGGDENNFSTILMIFVVGLWSLNPVQTNAVTYIVQRMTSIATLFYFLSFGSYLRGRAYQRAAGVSGKVFFFYLFSLICFVCAMMSKENAATLPVMIFLVEWLLLEKSGFIAFLKRHKIAVFCMVVVAAGIVGYKFYHGWLLGGYAHRHFTLSERLLTELRIVVSYCGLLLLPLPIWLNLEHDVSLSTSLLSPLTTLFSLIFIVSVIYVAWRIRREKPLIAFAIFWFFINLLIESTVIPLELKFEHRLYLPSAGFYLAIVLLVRELYLHFYGDNLSLERIKFMVAVAVLICSGLSFLTYTRNIAWADTVSLYQDCISKAPNKPRSHSNLATAWLEKGEYDKALAEAEKAVELGVRGYEEYWVAACDIVTAFNLKGENGEAIIRGERLLKDAPEGTKKNSYPSFIYDLGRVYFFVGDFQSAFNYSLEGYKISYVNNLLGKAVGFEQLMERSLKTGLEQNYQFDSGMKFDTENPDIAVSVAEKMAQIFFELNNLDLASKYVEKIMTKDDSSVTANRLKKEVRRISKLNLEQKKLGTLKEKYLYHPFVGKFNFFMAICVAMEKYNLFGDHLLRYCLRQVELLNKNSPDVYIVKSWYFYKHKEYDKALKIIDRGIQLNSEYAQLWVNRGIYALATKSGKAYGDFNKALSLYPGYPHRQKIIAMRNGAKVLNNKNINK